MIVIEVMAEAPSARPSASSGAADAGVSNPASRDYDSTYRGRCPQGILAGNDKHSGGDGKNWDWARGSKCAILAMNKTRKTGAVGINKRYLSIALKTPDSSKTIR